MMLGEVLNGCDYVETSLGSDEFMSTEISGVAYDSRKVKEGCLFVAIKGERYDGHDYVRDAIGRGSVAIVVERGPIEMGQPCVLVEDGRRALACISNNFYGRPSSDLTLIGVTGTNGKTTTTYILKSILEAWGKGVGLIGTIQYMVKDKVYPAAHTTPESLEFQALLRRMYLEGCTHVVTEVSSHALSQYRVDGSVFHSAAFTNLTWDHLDFHGTMEDYFAAKERLFLELLDDDGTAVINTDDPYGRRLAQRLKVSRPGVRVITFGLAPEADISAGDIRVSFDGSRFKAAYAGESHLILSRLTGMPNVYNIISAVAVAISIGVPWQVILAGIENSADIAGRFERIDCGQKFLCVVDYAHTEDALERLIKTAREIASQSQSVGGRRPRIITVFGCGGDRDRGKRPRMGAVAASVSDFVFVTSDNPRSEDPMDIIKDIIGGMSGSDYLVEPDRRKAIVKAIEMARDGDVVLVAGKGHEDYQEIKGIRHAFSDRAVVKEAISLKLQSPEGGING